MPSVVSRVAVAAPLSLDHLLLLERKDVFIGKR